MQTSTEDSCDKQFNSWSELSTVSSFDSGDLAGSTCRPVDVSDVSNMVVRNLKPLSGVSLLVECLIEQLCKLLERDPLTQKKLYHVICNKLHSMNLLDETYGVEEFEFMRSHYQQALYHLLNVSKTVADTGSSVLQIPRIQNPVRNVVPLTGQNHLSWSRYQTEYQQLAFINKGGFGKVYKVRNKLDGEEYAVKKICLRYHNVKSFLQKLNEVKMLAKLNHPNIVSYKAAWLEPLDCSQLSGYSRRAAVSHYGHTSTSCDNMERVPSEDDSGGIEFKDTNSNLTKTENSENISSNSDSSSTRDDCVDSARYETEVSSSQDMSLVRMKNVWKPMEVISVLHEECAVLYIQMQLCDDTLRQWLVEHNLSKETSVDTRRALKIFHQIVSGVQYIHAKGIVHHDIKPSNIFVNADLSQVQVGDFGLACCFQHSPEKVTLLPSDPSPLNTHTRELGTLPYAAPEQLKGRCDPKSDLYSLGIVLFELLQPCATRMEQTKLISRLKTEKFLPAELKNQSPELAQLITTLISSSADKRPTATQLLDILDEISKHMGQAGAECDKDEVIHRLRQVICEKDEEIDRLSAKIRRLEHYMKLHKANGVVSN